MSTPTENPCSCSPCPAQACGCHSSAEPTAEANADRGCCCGSRCGCGPSCDCAPSCGCSR